MVWVWRWRRDVRAGLVVLRNGELVAGVVVVAAKATLE
jgi:hypothetical protein